MSESNRDQCNCLEYREVIDMLKAKLEVAVKALERVKHNSCCMVCSPNCPACNAHEALKQLRDGV